MIAFGVVGLAANGLAVAAMLRGRRAGEDLNLEAAFRHALADVAGALGVLVAGALVYLWSWQRADPAIALLVAAGTALGAIGLIREPLRVLLEQAPTDLDPDEVGAALCRLPGVRNVHDLHVWTITSGFVTLSMHVVAARGVDHDDLLHALQQEISSRFGISHSTIQIDEDHTALLQIHKPGCPAAPRARSAPLGTHGHDHTAEEQ